MCAHHHLPPQGRQLRPFAAARMRAAASTALLWVAGLAALLALCACLLLGRSLEVGMWVRSAGRAFTGCLGSGLAEAMPLPRPKPAGICWRPRSAVSNLRYCMRPHALPMFCLCRPMCCPASPERRWGRWQGSQRAPPPIC